MQQPGAIIIGGMKCGTTALHGYLARHPQIRASSPKELDFFFGDTPGGAGNWWRGADWYGSRFAAGPGLRMEASPGYTSPDHPEVAARMRALAPDAKLIYLVRDPLERAVSQYLHHRRDGHEQRPLAVALLDPDSQYISRSRHLDRLRPFVDRFPQRQIAVIEHRCLLNERRATLRSVFRWLGVFPDHPVDGHGPAGDVATTRQPRLPPRLRDRFLAAVVDDDGSNGMHAMHHRYRVLPDPATTGVRCMAADAS